ncbi:Zinc finger CCCH domain-containing protein 14 [Diplonema papillatum]|nr:Zinc finger CCCH domain-containing protein 14 [Diplonema papillatum]
MAQEETPPLSGLKADSVLATQIRSDIKNKLLAEYSDYGTEETMSAALPEYITVMICNAKSRSQVIEDLQLFLKDATPRFVDWLWLMLSDRNPKRTHSAFDKAHEAMEEDAPRADNHASEQGPAQPAPREDHTDRKRIRDRDEKHYPSARGFRQALEVVARGETERDRDKGRDREKDATKEADPRDRRRRRHGSREGDRKGKSSADPERRERDRDRPKKDKRSRRHAKEDDANPAALPPAAAAQQPPSLAAPLAAGPAPAAAAPGVPAPKFRITDTKGAERLIQAHDALKLDVLPSGDRDLLSAPGDGRTRFTITMNKLNLADIPTIPEPAPVPPMQLVAAAPLAAAGVDDSYDMYGKGAKGGKGTKDGPQPASMTWNHWTGFNMTYTGGRGRGSAPAAGKGGKGGPLEVKPRPAAAAAAYRQGYNLVWQNPATMTEEEKLAAAARRLEVAVARRKRPKYGADG